MVRAIKCPLDIQSGSKKVLGAYFTRPDTSHFRGLRTSLWCDRSNHAYFERTMDYVRATNAKFVVTGNTRGGTGYELADSIKQRLGIEARPSSGAESRE